jgi:phosphate transport system substrate-binding protein
MLIKSLVVVVAAALVSSITHAADSETVRVAAAVFPLSSVFSKIKAPFESATGMKLEFITNANSTGLNAEEAFLAVSEGKADAGAAGLFWLDWKKHLEGLKFPEARIDEMKFQVIARDLMQIVTDKSGMKNLDDTQILKLFTGKINNWKEIGGPDLRVTVVLADNLKATEKLFSTIALRGQPLAKEKAKIVPDIMQLTKTVEATPGAIAYMPLEDANRSNLNKPEHRALVRPVTLIARGEMSPKVAKLLNFIKTEGKKYGVNIND